jgi:hypothetical protein
LPQLHWIANLSQYLRPDTKIRIRNFRDFFQITNLNLGPAGVTAPTSEFVKMLFKDDANIELWLFLDQILLNLAGQEMTWTELLQHYQHNYPDDIKHVLP